jgi:RNA polymerase sigma-70 factor (ECF subfamily)
MQKTPGSDISLIAAFVGGSELAFTELFNNYHKWIFGEALFHCRNKDDAQDVVQEVFTALWEKRKTIDPNRGIRNYLYISMRNACIKKANKHQYAQNYINYQLSNPDSNGEAPDSSSEKNKEDLIQLVRKAVQQIKGKAAREAVQTIYLNEESYEDVARRTGQPVQSIRNAVARGIRFLRTSAKFRY